MRLRSALIAIIGYASSFVFAAESIDDSKLIGKITLLGGKVTRDETLTGHPVVGVSIRRSKRFNEKYLRVMRSFPDLRELRLVMTAVNDDCITEISELEKLTILDLQSVTVSNPSLTPLAKLHNPAWKELK